MRRNCSVYQVVKLASVLVVNLLVVVERANAQVLDAGFTTTYAINSTGNIVSWGQAFGPPNGAIPAISDAIAVTGGQEHALALRSNGALAAWGGSPVISPNPGVVPVNATGTYTAIAAGNNTSFALNSNGTVFAWGTANDNNNVVANANGLGSIQAISAGGTHFLALNNSGDVVARGRLNGVDAATSVPAITGVAAISAGTDHALALHNGGTVSAWGNNSAGQTSLPAIGNAVAISAGGTQSLILRSDGTVQAAGQLSSYDGIQNQTNVVYVTAGSFHSYAVRSDGTILGFGTSNNGQINTTVTNALNLPTTATWSTASSGDYLNSHRWEQGIPSTANSNAVFGESGTYSVNFGNDAQALSLSVSGGGNVTFNQNANDFNAGSSINVSGTGTSLTVTGTGAGSELSATSLTNSATLAISTGSTVTAGSISNSGLISVATGGELASGGAFSNTGTIVNNGTITGNISTSGTGVLSGSGTVAGTAVTANGGVLAPGNSVGVVNGTNWEFGQAGTFNFEINDATGIAGGPSGWDALVLTGTLNITATSGNPFIVDIDSLSGVAAGNAANFNPASNYSWAFVTANAITGFAADLFSINSTGFTNGTSGGSFSISQSGNSLLVNFTSSITAVPEPSSLAILTIGGVGFAVYKRRRKPVVTA